MDEGFGMFKASSISYLNDFDVMFRTRLSALVLEQENIRNYTNVL